MLSRTYPLLLMALVGLGCQTDPEGPNPTPILEYFTVGGVLETPGVTLALRNNGTDEVQMTADGVFTFPTPLIDGSNYEVTVSNLSVNRTCTVANGNGTIAGANVTDVRVACDWKAWKTPSSLSDTISLHGSHVYDPSVAMNASGDTIISWSQVDTNTGKSQIYVAFYTNGSWLVPQFFSEHVSQDGSDATYPSVSIANDRVAIVVWSQKDGSTDCVGAPCLQIYKAEYRDGVWYKPLTLADHISPSGTDAQFPKVVMNNVGDILVSWYQEKDGAKRIYKAEYHGTWVYPSLSDYISPNGDNVYFPRIAMADNGDAIIVWGQSDGTYEQLFKAERRSQTWAYPATVADHFTLDVQPAGDYSVSMNSSGDTVIAYVQWDGTYNQIYKSEYRNNAWVYPLDIDENISPDACGGSYPEVAIDNLGEAVIVWAGIFKSEYRNNDWTHPISCTDYVSTETGNYPKVTMNDAGNTLIAWTSGDGAFNIYKAEYLDGAWRLPSSEDDHVNISGSGIYMDVIASGANGNAFIVWHQSDGSFQQEYVAEYR